MVGEPPTKELEDIYKELIINSLKKLVDKDLMEIYGFVIMPKHMHSILKLLAPNGKEKPSSSFLKESAHLIKKDLLINNSNFLENFLVSEADRSYRIWQRDALAIELFNEHILEQKLTYIHNNPVQEKWSLSTTSEDYYWSSAKFYESGIDEFKILKHYKDFF
jgi:putative transposase